MVKKIALTIFLSLSSLLISQDVEMNLVNAKDEFKWGVKFYNQGLYEKSVFSFERSLSFNPADYQTHLWLGHAYYMKGDVEAALKEWSILKDNDQSPLWLESAMDIITVGRGVEGILYTPREWVPLYTKDFPRPSSLLTKDDGTTIIVSFKSNKLTFLNVNGGVINSVKGGFEPFSGPFDIIEADDNSYIVSELLADKISFVNNLGIKTKSINPEESPLAGPQFLTKDDMGYFYVSDWGNKRVCKFDMEGNLVLSIKDEKLKGPTGVLALGDRLYVADQLNKTLLVFDISGNFIDYAIKEGLEAPEGLTKIDNKRIMIADGTTLKEFNLEDQVIKDISDLQGKASRITKGVIDVNGNTLTTDFNLGQFYSLTDVSSLYGGMYMNIDRISSSNFPEIEVELQVYNRLGEPVVGLENTNFLVSENGKIVPTRNIVFKGHDNKAINLGIILDLDTSMYPYLESYYDIAESIVNEKESNDRITVVNAGLLPTIGALPGTDTLEAISGIKSVDFGVREGIDLSIKLGATSLIPSRQRRELLLVTNGNGNSGDFTKYSLDEIRDFLKNNRISLSVLYVGQNRSEELEYLVKETNGFSRYLYEGVGSKGILRDSRKKKSGFYVVKYDSLKTLENGDRYSSVEIELNYIRKSGRTESGYFVPVKVVK